MEKQVLLKTEERGSGGDCEKLHLGKSSSLESFMLLFRG